MEMKDLKRENIYKLRKEIVLNSLFIRDYQNSFDIDPTEVSLFFDGYIEFLVDKYQYAGEDDDFYTFLMAHDTKDDLEDYYDTIDW